MERNRCTDPAGRGYCGRSRGEERTAHQFNIVCGDRETGMVRFITWGPQSLPSVQSINLVKESRAQRNHARNSPPLRLRLIIRVHRRSCRRKKTQLTTIIDFTPHAWTRPSAHRTHAYSYLYRPSTIRLPIQAPNPELSVRERTPRRAQKVPFLFLFFIS